MTACKFLTGTVTSLHFIGIQCCQAAGEISQNSLRLCLSIQQMPLFLKKKKKKGAFLPLLYLWQLHVLSKI